MQTETSHAGRRLKSPRSLEQTLQMPTYRPTLQLKNLKRPSKSWSRVKHRDATSSTQSSSFTKSQRQRPGYVRSSRRVSEDPSYRRPGAVLPSWRSQNQINLRKTPSHTDPSHCYASRSRFWRGWYTAASTLWWTHSFLGNKPVFAWSVNGGPSNTTNTRHRRQLSEQWEGWGSVYWLDSCMWHRVATWTPPVTA